MFGLVLNTFLILPNIFIWYAYGSIEDNTTSGSISLKYFIYTEHNEWTDKKYILQKDKIYCFNCQKLTPVSICI